MTRLVVGLKVARLECCLFSVEVAMLVLTVEEYMLAAGDRLTESCLLMERLGEEVAMLIERLGEEVAMLMVGLEDILLGKSV